MELVVGGTGTGWRRDEVRHLVAAEGYIALGLYGEADEELRQVDPWHLTRTPTLLLKLCVHAGLHQWDLVQDIAATMATYDAQNPCWFVWLATAVSRIRSITAARKILLEALELHPDSANIHYNLSCYEKQLRHVRRAAHHRARAIELEPRYEAMAKEAQDHELLWMGPGANLEFSLTDPPYARRET